MLADDPKLATFAGPKRTERSCRKSGLKLAVRNK